MYVCCGTIMLLCVLQFYILRKLIEHELGEQEVGEDECYICSLSSRILVYKGQLTPGQVYLLSCVLTPAPVNGQVHLWAGSSFAVCFESCICAFLACCCCCCCLGSMVRPMAYWQQSW